MVPRLGPLLLLAALQLGLLGLPAHARFPVVPPREMIDTDPEYFWFHPDKGSRWELGADDEQEDGGWTKKDLEKYFWMNLLSGAVSWDPQKGARHYARGTKDQEGGRYFYVDGWGDATWENPYPSDWRAVLDEVGREYFVNDETQEASWSVPQGEDKLAWVQVHADYDPEQGAEATANQYASQYGGYNGGY